MKKKVSNILVGVSGEYFVAAELSRRGYIASITLRNTKGIDIVASSENGDKSVNIQVKSTSKKGIGWLLSKKAETVKDKNIFYVFVDLNEDEKLPIFHIVPCRDVAKKVKDGHQNWLKTPGKKGQKHKDTNIRVWYASDNKYLNRWDLLKLDKQKTH